MEIVRRSEAFLQFLDSLRDREEGADLFLDEYKASVIRPETSTPFSTFVGQHNRTTVVISKHVPESLDSSTNIEGELELLVDLETSQRGAKDLFPVVSQQTISLGQPLESSRVYLTHSMPFYRGWSGTHIHTSSLAQDNGLIPLPLGSARFIASLYSLCFRKAAGTLPDVWVLCERNLRNIIALGCRCSPQHTLQIFTVEGNAIAEPNLKADLAYIDNRRLSAGTVFSEYDMVTSGILDEEPDQSGAFKIQFSWNDPDGMVSPPPESANAILKVSNVPGDQFSPVLHMYEELQSLYRLCKISNGELDWPAPEEDEGILASSGNRMADEVDAFIHDMAQPLTKPADVTVLSPTTDHMIYEPRTDLDFTEHLWLFCRDLRSFDELQLVFAEVFKALLLGKIQPFIHRKSTSKLAMLLKQVLLRPATAALQDIALQFQLLLAESRLLPYLVQLGIEKMRRDYQKFFTGTDICSSEQFEQFFAPSSSSLLQCLELCRIHSVLELNATIMKMLGLPSTTLLSTFTKAAMEVFKADPHYKPFQPTPVFSFPLPAYSPALKPMVALCSKLSPVTWCVTLEGDRMGEEGGRSTSAGVMYLLKKQPFFHYLFEQPTNQRGTSPPPKDGYYLHKCYCDSINYF